jgi:ribosomal protein L16 Arg81 hydroxylase
MDDTGAVITAQPPHLQPRKKGAYPWSDVLDYMIGPMTREEFLSRYYEREHLIVHRDDPGRYSPLLSVERIDAFLSSADLRAGMVDLADASRQMSRDQYVNDGDLIIRRDVMRQYQLGATVILPQLHHSDPVLSSFCQAIEEQFTCHTQTNIYLTPPDRQGFPTHYDNHDVFVLQVSGEKLWRLYDVAVDTPYRGEGFQRDVHKVGDLRAEFVLRPGDCVYIPRGLMHDANTSGPKESLHITVGVIVKTWADLMLESVSQLMVEDTAFRRSLPAGYARNDFDRASAQKVFDELKGRIAARIQMDDAMDLLSDQFIRSRDQNVAGALLDATKPVTPDLVYQRQEFVPWRIAEDGEAIVLISAGGDMDFKPEDRPALERAMSGEPFRVSDLACEDPEEVVFLLQSAGAIGRV